MAITATDFQNIALAISAYSDAEYTSAKKLTGTGIVGTDIQISVTGESYIGQFRWYKTISPVVNVPSLSTATDGSFTDISTDMANYVKNARSSGAKQVNLQEVISRQDGLAKFSRDYTEIRTQDEHDAILATLQGVAANEAAVGAGIVSFDTLASESVGLFVDVNAEGQFGAAATNAGDERKLIDSTKVGAARGERLFTAIGMGFKDYEPPFFYMITPPSMLAELRAANLVDPDRITDGELEFQTIFGGKFRLILTRANQGNNAASANVNDRSTKTTFIVKPGSIAWSPVPMPNPVEVDRKAAAYGGGGTTEIWYRWGYVVHPKGYDWTGATNTFATNTTLAAAASWDRVYDHLNLGILPIFHA